MALIFAGCNASLPSQSIEYGEDVVELTSDNFQQQVLNQPGVVMVDCYADWCGPCHQFAPTVSELATEYKGRAVIGRLNVDESRDQAVEYGVSVIPTVLLFKDGELVEKGDISAGEQGLRGQIDSLLGTGEPGA